MRAVDEKASRADSGAAVADLAGRVGSLEDSLGHLAQARSVPLQLLLLLLLLPLLQHVCLCNTGRQHALWCCMLHSAPATTQQQAHVQVQQLAHTPAHCH